MAKIVAGNIYEFIDESMINRIKKSFSHDKDFNRLIKKSDLVKFHADGDITLIEFEDFTKLNPVIKYWHKFRNVSPRYTQKNYVFEKKLCNSKTNPLIIHRKEEMFTENFCPEFIEFHKKWTNFYEKSGIRLFKDKTKIGRKVYWNAALAELKEKFPEQYSEFEDFI